MTRHEMSLFSIVMGDAALAQAEQNIRWLHHRIEDSYCGDRLLWAWLTPDACLVQAESGSTPEGFRAVCPPAARDVLAGLVTACGEVAA